MKKIKIISLLMVLVMIAGLVSGCGGKDKQASTDGVTEITMWSSNSHSRAFMTEKVDEFNRTIGKENGIKFVYEVREDAGQQIKIALQSGTEPDLFAPGTLSEFAENNYIVPLDAVPGIAETVAKNNRFKEENSSHWNGKQYRMSVGSSATGLAYNKDLFKKAGLVDENGEAKPPETIEELVEYAKILTDKEQRQYGIIFPLKWGSWYDMELAAPSIPISGKASGCFNVQDGVYDFNGIKPLASAFLQMKEDGSIYPGAEGLDNDPARARFAEGNIGMKFAAMWDVGVWNSQFVANSDWGIAPVPVASKEERYMPGVGCSYSISIGKNGLERKGAEKIAVVFNWLYSDEMQIAEGEAGISLPNRPDLIEKCDFSKSPKGWSDFAEIVKVGTNVYGGLPRDLSAYESDGVDFVNRVWSGKITLDQWIEDRNRISAECVELYKKNNPTRDFSYRVNPDFDIRIKN